MAAPSLHGPLAVALTECLPVKGSCFIERQAAVAVFSLTGHGDTSITSAVWNKHQTSSCEPQYIWRHCT